MKSAVFFEKAGKSVPEAVLKAAFESVKPTCLGIAACAVDGDGSPLIMLEHIHDLKSIGTDWPSMYKEIKEFQDALSDTQNILVMSESAGVVTVKADNAEEFDTSDMMPFATLTENSNGYVHLVSVLIGDYSQYAKKESKHLPEFFAHTEEIVPRVGGLMEATDNDLDKTLASMQKPIFTKDTQRLIGGDAGLACFMSSDGTVINVTKGDDVLKEADYGWTTFGDVPKVEEAPPTKAQSVLKSLTGRFNKAKPASSAPKNVADEPKVEPKVDVPKAEPDKAEPKILEVPAETKIPEETKYVQCPSHLTTKQEIGNWYLKNAGYKPDGYRKRPKVAVRHVLPDNKSLKDLDKVVASKTGPTEPIIPAELRKELLEDAVVLKILDKSSQVIPTQQQIEEIEKKYSTFSEQLGGKIELRNLHAWSFDDIKQFRTKFPEAADVLMQSLIWAHTRHTVANTKEAPAEAPKVDETPKQTPVADPKPADAPKKTAFSFTTKKKAVA